ncbi:MAG: hypothetical protein NT069_16830, partial [Planctomycetota bacterium]|nr:hypothetical protein [Planctomycetota bacterium]
MLRMFFLTLSSLGCLVTVCLAEEFVTTSDKAVRESVARSLSYLEKEGVTWMEERGCMSCHHVPFLLWAHRAAQGRGLVVDTEKLMEWNEWARNDSLSHRNLFRLQNYDLGKVDAAILPDTVKEKLKPLIEEPFKSEEALIARLKPLLTEDDLKSYQELILKTAERGPYAVDRAGGGLDVLGQLLLGDKAARGGLGEREFRDGEVALMRQIQL